ncbi:MAG: EpsI family protein, partial [Alphaproteobacteria bacterium]|nr:EpsI family protein [Alphaproteobacteria bacterium]
SILTQCATLNNQPIQIKIVYYPHQDGDHSLLFFKNQMFDDTTVQWKKTSSYLIEQNNHQIPFNLETLYRNNEDIPIAVTYWINGFFTNSKIKVKINQALSQMKYGHQTGFLVMVLLPKSQSSNDTYQNQLDKVVQSLPDLSDLFSKIPNASNASKPQ